MNKFEIENETELLKFLIEVIPGAKNKAKNLLARKQVMVNGIMTTKFNFLLKKGDVISIINYIDENIPILYEDKNFVVIDKPSGLLSVGTEKETKRTAMMLVSDYVKKKNKNARIFAVHRLDKDTSGVLVFAKDSKVKDKLQDNWNEIVSKRGYIAICEGTLPRKKGTIKSYLYEDKNFNVRTAKNSKDGKLAITHFNLLKENKNISLIEVFIDTGRKNQIRVHMQELGTPILGDMKYGRKKSPIRRLCLHAHVLKFKHQGKTYEFKSDMPSKFNKVI